MSTRPATQIIEVRMEQLRQIVDRAQREPLSEEECRLLLQLAESYVGLTQMLKDRATTIERLRKLVFGSTSEKTRDVLGIPAAVSEQAAPESAASQEQDREDRPRPPGHGRHGAAAYVGAQRITLSLRSLKSGDKCPECPKGKLYPLEPGVILRVTGQAPLQATVWEREKLRCNCCGKVFTAPAPEGIGEAKYDAKAPSMIAVLKYGSGLPFNRLGVLQENLGIPLPPSTQWDIVSEVATQIEPAYGELIRQAAQGRVVHNDDTGMTILGLMGERRARMEEAGPEEAPERTGVFTSGIVSTTEGRRIALFFTGPRHAGENLQELLAQRASELGPPIQMCDALSRNTSEEFETIVANCLAHGRRKFVDVAAHFPAECRHVLETLREVYRNDAAAKEQGMSPEERLRFHQARSAPLMDELHRWMTEQIEQKKVEPNSGLGEAIGYMLRHWEKLTVFLRTPGAPLDNNLCERALKKAILHRKNCLFYKSVNGARVGDLFMSLIHTCHLAGVSAFDYLTALQENIGEVVRDPAQWMPWNYRDAQSRDGPGGSNGE